MPFEKKNPLSTFTFEYGTFTSEYTISRSEQKNWRLNFAAMSVKVSRNFQSGWLWTEKRCAEFFMIKIRITVSPNSTKLPGDDENRVHFCEWLHPLLQTLSGIIFTIKATRQYFIQHKESTNRGCSKSIPIRSNSYRHFRPTHVTEY
jgi:hypothetical protein